MSLEVKHYYQINDLNRGTFGKRHEIEARLLNSLSLERTLPQNSEIVFTTDFSEDIKLGNNHTLWLVCSGAFPHVHEFWQSVSPGQWAMDRYDAMMENLDPEYDFAREHLGIFAITNSDNLEQTLYTNNSEGEEISTDELGIKYKTIYLLDGREKVVAQAHFRGEFEGFSYPVVQEFVNQVLMIYKSQNVKTIEEAAKVFIESLKTDMLEKEGLERLAELIAKAFQEPPEMKRGPEQLRIF